MVYHLPSQVNHVSKAGIHNSRTCPAISFRPSTEPQPENEYSGPGEQCKALISSLIVSPYKNELFFPLAVNSVTLVGRMGDDPVSRNDGKLVTFSLATSKYWKNKETGDWAQKTEWHNIQVFNQPNPYLLEKVTRFTKGDRVMVDGQISYYSNKDRNDAERYYTSIIADNIIWLAKSGKA